MFYGKKDESAIAYTCEFKTIAHTCEFKIDYFLKEAVSKSQVHTGNFSLLIMSFIMRGIPFLDFRQFS